MNRTGGTMTGPLIFSGDNTHDIGASGATRPRDIFLGRDLTVGRNATVAGTLGVTGATTLSSTLGITGATTANGAVTLGDTTGDDITITGRIAAGITWKTDNTHDLGASGANRPRDLWLGRNAAIGGTLGVTGATTLAGLSATTGAFSSNATVGGTLGVTGAATFSSTGAFGGVVGLPDGSVSAPALMFSADTNTGIYRTGADGFAVAAGGVEHMRWNSGAAFVGNGSATSPSLAFLNSAQTGFYRYGANQLGVAANGVAAALFAEGVSNIFGALTISSHLTVGGSEVEFTNLGATTGTDLVVDGFGVVHKKSSSRRYKVNERAWRGDPRMVLKLQPKQFDYRDGGARDVLFFMAEDVAAVDPVFVNTDQRGRPESIRTDALVAALVALAQQQDARIKQLEARVRR